VVRRSGRRPGKQDTRTQILHAARDLFARYGYDGASIRQIAAGAGVDPALVHHYFGTKEKLFHEVLEVPVRPAELIPAVFAEGPDQVPERLVRTFIGVWEHPVTGPAMVTFLRTAVSHGVTSGLVREFYTTKIVRTVVDELGDRVSGSDTQLRVSLVASQLFGLALTRYVFGFQPLADTRADDVVAAVAPTVRRYLFGELGPADRATPD
jgi:AcrR family transcriptional regulator